jgi:hypothetical protein
MSLKHDIVAFARELEATDAEAFSLWTWLPSRKMAEKAHGDYADEFQPTLADLMNEATAVLILLSFGPNEPRGLNDPYVSRLKEEHTREVFRCSCDECPVPTEEEIFEHVARFTNNWGPTG